MSQLSKIRLAVSLAMVVNAGCVSSDERLDNLPLRSEQYHAMDHFPPAPESGDPIFAEMVQIRRHLSGREFGPALKEMDRLISVQRRAKSTTGTLPQLLVLRGMARFTLHNPNGALADYDEAIALDNGYWPAYFHRWQCHLEFEDFSAAKADRETGRKLAPEQFEQDHDPHPAGVI